MCGITGWISWLTSDNGTDTLLKGSVEERHVNQFRCDFSSSSECTEIWHANSFCVTKCPCFFPQVRKKGFKHAFESPPPPLQWRETHVHSVLVLKDRNPTLFGDGERERRGGGGGVGGWVFAQFCLYFSALLKKRGIFNTIKSWHAKFQCLLSNLKNGNEIH